MENYEKVFFGIIDSIRILDTMFDTKINLQIHQINNKDDYYFSIIHNLEYKTIVYELEYRKNYDVASLEIICHKSYKTINNIINEYIKDKMFYIERFKEIIRYKGYYQGKDIYLLNFLNDLILKLNEVKSVY